MDVWEPVTTTKNTGNSQEKAMVVAANMGADGYPKDKPQLEFTNVSSEEDIQNQIKKAKQKAHDDNEGWEEVWSPVKPAESSNLENLMGVGTAALDIVGGIPGFIGGTTYGITSGLMSGKPSEGLEKAKEAYEATSPTSLLKKAGIDLPKDNKGYEYAMKPFEWLNKGIEEAASQGTKALDAFTPGGIDPKVQEQINPALQLGTLGAMGLSGFRRKPVDHANLTKGLQDVEKKEPTLPPEPVKPRETTTAHADDYAAINPYDTAGHVTALEEGRPTTLDNPQGELFGGKEEGSLTQSKIEDVNPDSLLNDQHKTNQVPYEMSLVDDNAGWEDHYTKLENRIYDISDEKRMATPERIKALNKEAKEIMAQQQAIIQRVIEKKGPPHESDGGVRTIDPDTGKVVQGMDKSFPTLDFPLKQELMDKDPVITHLREQVTTQLQQIEHLKEAGAGKSSIMAVEKSMHDMMAKFGDYMDQSYGVKSPADIYGALVETGKPTKLPVKSTFNPRGKQGGAINVGEIKEGFKSLRDRFRTKTTDDLTGAGVPKALADIVAQSAKEPDQPSVINNAVKYLKDAEIGKGLADLTYLDKTPEEVIEMSKGVEDIKRAPVQENIENGGLFRGLATKNPIVKYTTERFNRATQAAQRLIRDHLTDPETGLKGFMRKLDATEKGKVWARMSLDEGKAVSTPEQLRELGWSEHEIDLYQKYREVDEMMFQQYNEARAKLGMKPMDQRLAHIAGRFMGDFRASARRTKLDKDNNPIFNENGLPETEYIGHIGGKTKWEVDRTIKFMKEMHPDWDFSGVEYKKIGKGNAASDRFAGLMEVVNKIAEDSGHVSELVDAYRALNKSDTATYLNALRHSKGKKAASMGIEGSEGNKLWKTIEENADEGFKASLAYMEQGLQWVEMQKASADIRKVTSDPTIIESQPNAVAWSAMHSDHVLGRNQGFLTDTVNSLMSTIGEATGSLPFGLVGGHSSLIKGSNAVKHFMMQKFMGFLNIPFTLTQLAQPLQTIPPMLALMKSRGVEFSMAKAGAESTSTMMKLLFDKINPSKDGKRFTEFEQSAIDYAHENAVFDVQMVDHTRDINVSRGKEMFDAVADANIKYPELITRGVAYMTFVHALKDTGMSHAEIFSTAENMTRMTMADYTTTARPAMYDKLGFLGDLASTLTRYMHNQASQMTFYGREAKAGLKRGEITPSIPLATFLTTSLAFSGIYGPFGYKTADELVRAFSEHVLQKPTSLTSLIMESNVPAYISHGVSALAGVDMTSRFSNAKVIPESIGEFLLPFGTGLLDMGQTAYKLATTPNSHNAAAAAKSWLPSSVTGAMENHFMSEQNSDGTHGYINPRTGERNYNRTESDRSKREFGFRSMNESKEMARLYEQKQTDMAESRIRTNIMDKAVSEYLSGSMTKEQTEKYAQKYMAAGSDQFARDYAQAIEASKLTAEQRYVKRNAGNNYSGATNLKELFNKGK